MKSSQVLKWTAQLAAVTLTAIVGLSMVATAASAATVTGPVYPGPGMGTFSSTGTPTGGEIGKAGGITWSYTGVDTTQFTQMVWGAGYPAKPITYSFGVDTATLSYDSGDSNLAGGIARYRSTVHFPNQNGTTPAYDIRFTFAVQSGGNVFESVPVPGLDGIDSTVGAVLPVTGDYSVNLLFEVSTDGGTTWTPANDYFNATAHTTGTSTSSSVDGDFWYTPPGAPAVSFSANPFDVGTSPVGVQTQSTLTVTNTGNAPLSITQVNAGGEFGAPSTSCVGNPVAPNGTCTITVTFTPSAAGNRSGTLQLIDNAPDNPSTDALTGVGTQAAVTLSPNPLAFDPVNLGSSATRLLTIANTGTATLNISGLDTTGGANPGDFGPAGMGNCSQTLAAHTSCQLPVQFTPTGLGNRSALWTFSDNAPDTPQQVTLTGTGTQAAASVSPSNLDFGTKPVGQTSAIQAVTVSAGGTGTLSVSGFAVSGANAGDFSLTAGSCPAAPFQLSSGQACTVDVAFDPLGIGARNANLVVSDDAGSGSQQVLLGGNGVPSADVAVFVQASAYRVTAGQPVTFTLTIDNFGPDSAAAVSLRDILPNTASFVGFTTSAGSCSAPPVGATGTIVCNLGTLVSGGSDTVTVTVTLGLPGRARDAATVKSPTFDPVKANNKATASILGH